ncbi:TetR/AcrR family transcriptional regulator [Candidatus Pantoea persica]|uniref:TetR/AcrR family transcriptional regulator n=1 Tax=Candidatus Pantoea persica TaxID=2518128 RepID=UPI0035A93639
MCYIGYSTDLYPSRQMIQMCLFHAYTHFKLWKFYGLNTAESLFNANGYTAVGVDLIRNTAGVSKTSMYRHFGSKIN